MPVHYLVYWLCPLHESLQFPLFISLQTAQAGRELGLATLYNRFFIHPGVAELVYFDGWIALGLFAFVARLAAGKVGQLSDAWHYSILATILSLGFILISSGEYSYHGWYNYTLFPYLVLFITYVFQRIYEGNAYLGGLVWMLLLANLKNILNYTGMTASLSNLEVRGLYLLGFLPLADSLFKLKNLRRNVTIALAITSVIFNGVAVLTVNEPALRAAHDFFFYSLQQ